MAEDSIKRQAPLTAFHYFPLLPFELRELIWKFAVRPAVPGAHFFTVKHDQSRGFSSEFQALHPYRNGRQPWCLGAPRCLPKTAEFTRDLLEATPPSWLHNNPSSYLIDSGLWSACRESRLVMEQAFRRPEHHGENEWGITKSVMDEEVDEGQDASWNHNGLFALPGVTSFAAKAGNVPRFFSVIPNRDLFILQPFDLCEWLEWLCTGLTTTFDIIPPYSPDSLPLPREEWNCRRQIALEYDISWDSVDSLNKSDSPAMDVIRYLVGEDEYKIRTFWFIDYRINPNALSGRYDSPQQVFRASDRRYTEVPEQDYFHLQPPGLWNFIRVLLDEEEKVEIEEALFYGSNPETYCAKDGVRFGILACEYL
ncbi:hypothetical protein QBC47DRAFT_378394 [Echria macrotheca]|uniref:2EXR domain-containing protein n=1 Tax=Echria macrotheca TaxID=438768 RepID=A0AAJ0F6P2_9PEZI|nr:hypothetical protein QBC47DRAFT_378394 [Echria macrotheca]